MLKMTEYNIQPGFDILRSSMKDCVKYKVGQALIPINGVSLYGITCDHKYGIVISADPLVLASPEGDSLWNIKDRDLCNFKVVNVKCESVMILCTVSYVSTFREYGVDC